MDSLILFVVAFVIIFIIYLVAYFYKRARGNLFTMKEFEVLANRCNLKKSDLNVNKLGLIIALGNSFIIAFTGAVCSAFDIGYIWQLALAFVMLMSLIYIFYRLLGNYILKGKGRKNNERKRNRSKVAKVLGRK